MKHEFAPPIEETVGEIAVLVKGASVDRGGTQIVASLECWNGTLLHGGRVDLASEIARKKFVNAVQTVHPETDAAALAATLVRLYSQVPALMRAARAESEARSNPAQIEISRADVAGLLDAEDPLRDIAHAIRRQGFGGRLEPALIVELAVTSRLLAMRPGAMPVHLLLEGPPSAGKSYTLSTILRLHPAEAYHVIDAGSPRVLLYDTAPLKHRALIFSEADSLPAGEDNPAASAVRGLLQEHHLVYKVTVLNPETNRYEVQDVVKEGPTVMITTAVHQLGEQLGSRLFTVDVPYDLQQLQAALATQAGIELNGAITPNQSVIDYHAYLQSLAPWDVTVPFASALATLIGRSAAAPRINRDYARLLSLIKAASILRHAQRDVKDGRLVATIADYEAVYHLCREIYESAATGGASKTVRTAVEGVGTLKRDGRTVTVTLLAEHLGLSKMAASRATRTAIKYGWLANEESRKGFPANFVLGEPMPERAGLPTPEAVAAEGGCNAVTPTTVRSAEGFFDVGAGDAGASQRGSQKNTFAPPTVGGVTALHLSREGVTSHAYTADTPDQCGACGTSLSAAEVGAEFGRCFACLDATPPEVDEGG